MRLDGSVVLITGASRGIGRATAVHAAALGARVVALARSGVDLERLSGELGSDSVFPVVSDVRDYGALGQAIADAERVVGPIDVVVANAGIGAFGPFAETSWSELQRLVEVNVLGTMAVLRQVTPRMMERGRGHVCVVGSVAGRIGVPLEAAYSATKFAAAGLAEALRAELRPHGCGVSLVSLGPVDTTFYEARGAAYDRRLPRLLSEERAAGAVVSAIVHERPEVFLPRWLRSAVLARQLLPVLARSGTWRIALSRRAAWATSR